MSVDEKCVGRVVAVKTKGGQVQVIGVASSFRDEPTVEIDTQAGRVAFPASTVELVDIEDKDIEAEVIRIVATGKVQVAQDVAVAMGVKT